VKGSIQTGTAAALWTGALHLSRFFAHFFPCIFLGSFSFCTHL
jgi:hypothetical protein